MSAILPQKLIRNGFTLTRILQKGHCGMYRQHWNQAKTNEHDGYEVVVGKYQKARTFVRAGKTINVEEGYFYPSNDDWGKYGFTYPDYDHAYEKFKELIHDRATTVE